MSVWCCLGLRGLFLTTADPALSAPAAGVSLKVQSVEDFVPEESLDRSFLEDPAPQRDKGRLMAKAPHGDSDR